MEETNFIERLSPMSNNQYFASPSRLTFERLDQSVEKDAQDIENMIGFGESIGVSASILDALRAEKPTGKQSLTKDEIIALREAIEVAGFTFFGVYVDKKGIHFNGGEQGTIYDLADKFEFIFQSVKDTVVFNGTVEVHGTGIDEHMKIVVEKSKATSYDAEIKWVKSNLR